MPDTTTYHDEDADLGALANETIAIVGYGNQGRSQALNLRDSGLKVIVGNIGDASKDRAREDGFEAFDIPEAVRRADVVMLLIPDEVMPLYYDLLLGSEADPAQAQVQQKRRLAREIVARFYDHAAAEAAETHFDTLFKAHAVPDDIEDYSIGANGADVHMPGLLSEAFGLSRSEARRLIEQGGVSLDGEAIPADRLDLPPAELDGKVIKVGKRRFKRLVA